MELPPALRQEVEAALADVPLAALARAAEALSQRYRAEVRDGARHVDSALAARAYLATRLPATYAAVCAALAAVAERRPNFAPRSVLDAGAGPGTATWAACASWPGIADALLIEASPAMRACGEMLARAAAPVHIAWQAADLAGAWNAGAPRDLVLAAYVIGELDAAAADALVARLWAQTADTLVIVEPGTPSGWQRVLRARGELVARGAPLVAPCPHAQPCPLSPPDWCHFARRVARSRLHRRAKGGEVPWEDEKYIYIAASRTSVPPPAARVIARPRAAAGQVTLKLCRHDGSAGPRHLSRREGAAFRVARRVAWGDAWPE